MKEQSIRKVTIVEVLKIFSIIYAVFLLPASANQPLSIVFLILLIALLVATIWNYALKQNTIFLVIEFLINILAVLLTGYLSSPFLPYFLSSLVSSSFNSTLLFILIYGVSLFTVGNLHILRNKNLTTLTLPVNFFIFGIIIFALLINYRSSERLKSNESLEENEEEKYEGLESIRSLIEFQKKIKSSISFPDLYRNFLSFLQTYDYSKFLIYFNQMEVFYLVEAYDDAANISDVTKELEFEPRNPPEIIFYGTEEFQKMSSLPEVTVYLTEKSIKDFDYATLKLAVDLFSHRAAEMYLQETEKQLLTRLATLYDTSKKITKELELLPIIETAATAVKRMTGMQKSVVCLCEEPEKIEQAFYDKSLTVVKGILTEHPEKIWISGFFKAAKDAITNKKPVLASFSEFSLSLLCIPISFQNRVYGVIAGITSLPKEEAKKDLKTMEVIAALIGSARANADLLKRREELVVNMERDRIAKDMHDNIIQSLFSLLLMIETASKKIEENPAAAESLLSEIKNRLQQTIQQTRESIISLYPKALSSEGFRAALENLISGLSDESHSISLEMENMPETLPIDYENALLRIIQEACSNAIRHGNAQNINIKLFRFNDKLEVTIEDNGQGFDTAKLQEFIDSPSHFGISSIISRVEALGGTAHFESEIDKGTAIRISLPLRFEDE